MSSARPPSRLGAVFNPIDYEVDSSSILDRDNTWTGNNTFAPSTQVTFEAPVTFDAGFNSTGPVNIQGSVQFDGTITTDQLFVRGNRPIRETLVADKTYNTIDEIPLYICVISASTVNITLPTPPTGKLVPITIMKNASQGSVVVNCAGTKFLSGGGTTATTNFSIPATQHTVHTIECDWITSSPAGGPFWRWSGWTPSSTYGAV